LLERKMEHNKCGNLQWVPYNESSNYGIDAMLHRGLAGDKRELLLLNENDEFNADDIVASDGAVKTKQQFVAAMDTSNTGVQAEIRKSEITPQLLPPQASSFAPSVTLAFMMGSTAGHGIMLIIIAIVLYTSHFRIRQKRKGARHVM
jgi:hypothetical protein